MVTVGTGKPKWKRYTSKNSGHHNFQVDLVLVLINCAIEQKWDRTSEWPCWMRQLEFVPFNCGECYFCIHGHTTGVQHRQKRQKVKVVPLKSGTMARAERRSKNIYAYLGKDSKYCNTACVSWKAQRISVEKGRISKQRYVHLIIHRKSARNHHAVSSYVMIAGKSDTMVTVIFGDWINICFWKFVMCVKSCWRVDQQQWGRSRVGKILMCRVGVIKRDVFGSTIASRWVSQHI